jgi:S-adenosylmethionine:tRNA-ribosyltransferase-isomerase (queuine synthetase)
MLRGNIKLSKKEISEFFDLLKIIKLKDIFLQKETIRSKYVDKVEEYLEIKLNLKEALLDWDKKDAFVEYSIKMKSGRRIIFEQNTAYRISLTISDLEKAKSILKNEKIEEFFLKKQLNKIAWPFLRADFHNNLARVGIKPATLPLLK